VFLINLPVVLLGVVAVALLVPESRAARRPGLDPVGILTSCAGLAVLTHGTIQAGQHGWGNPEALAEMAGGLVLLAGLALMAVGFLVGATTRTDSGFAFVAGWTAVIGAGLGIGLATASSSALAELSPDRAGVGSAVMQTVQKVGAPLGAAVLGSVLNAGYRGRLPLDGLPPAAAGAARDSVFAALRVADQLGSARLRDAARGAFVHGMDLALAASGGIAAAAVLLALLFLPGRATPPATAHAAQTPPAPRGRPEREPHVA
jgi:hypothetical protein